MNNNNKQKKKKSEEKKKIFLMIFFSHKVIMHDKNRLRDRVLFSFFIEKIEENTIKSEI